MADWVFVPHICSPYVPPDATLMMSRTVANQSDWIVLHKLQTPVKIVCRTTPSGPGNNRIHKHTGGIPSLKRRNVTRACSFNSWSTQWCVRCTYLCKVCSIYCETLCWMCHISNAEQLFLVKTDWQSADETTLAERWRGVCVCVCVGEGGLLVTTWRWLGSQMRSHNASLFNVILKKTDWKGTGVTLL